MDPNSQPKTIHPRPQTNDNCNGPRVSFNKDVHVKRIGNFVEVATSKPNILIQAENKNISDNPTDSTVTPKTHTHSQKMIMFSRFNFHCVVGIELCTCAKETYGMTMGSRSHTSSQI